MLPEVNDGHGKRAIQTLQMVDIATGWVELVAFLGRSYLVMEDAFLFILGWGSDGKRSKRKVGGILGKFGLEWGQFFLFPSLLPYGRNVKLGRFGQNRR
jgi:hypothetical protein